MMQHIFDTLDIEYEVILLTGNLLKIMPLLELTEEGSNRATGRVVTVLFVLPHVGAGVKGVGPSVFDGAISCAKAMDATPASRVVGKVSSSMRSSLVGLAFLFPAEGYLKEVLINRGVLVKMPFIVCLAFELISNWVLHSFLTRYKDDLLPNIVSSYDICYGKDCVLMDI